MSQSTITRTMRTRDVLLCGADVLRRTAAAASGDEPGGGKEGEKTVAPALDMGQVRETFDELAAQGLAKKADIEKVLKQVEENPTSLCDVVRNMGAITKKAMSDRTVTDTEEAPGTLVKKKASSGSSGGMNFSDSERKIEHRVSSRRA